MMGRGHAMSGASLWLGGWSLAALAGVAHPRYDVLTVGTLICAGSALVNDLDHPASRIANAAGPVTVKVAKFVGWVGSNIHYATRLDDDTYDGDGHRTITHTLAFSVLAGCLVAGIAGLSDELGAWLAGKTGLPINPLGRIPIAAIVFFLAKLGYAAARSAVGGRQTKLKLKKLRMRKPTAAALLCAVYAYAMMPPNVWWLGLAVSAGCLIHCLGDMLTVGGCPILWPLPTPARKKRYDRTLRRKVDVWVWRTWRLFGIPRWMRFRVNSDTEEYVVRGFIVFSVFAIGVLVYAGGWGPAS